MTRRAFIVALAGSAVSLSQAAEPAHTVVAASGVKAPAGYVYVNGLTGERIVSHGQAIPVAARGAGWSWGISGNPCGGGLDTVFFVHDASLGDDGIPTPDDMIAWQGWMETPGDSIVTLISFSQFTQVLDPDEDGVDGQEMLLVFTEHDRAFERSGAVASTAIQFTNLIGAADDNGDGVIDFTEGNLWIYTYDLAGGDTPFDIEIGDTNGQYDGSYPGVGLFGVPGTDVDGDGMINSGYAIAWRQPNVSEGDQLINRFPELAGLGLENPDGPNADPASFFDMADIGVALAAPSDNSGCYVPFGIEWPNVPGCDDQPPYPIGTFDFFGVIDATGVDAGLANFGHFSCGSGNPWADLLLGFNIINGDPNPCPCDINVDGLLDLADIQGFITAFLAGDFAADINGDGVLDLSDISGPSGFIVCFLSGCP
ncbi:MAG: hypothetical protein H6810_12165 [Phycisphaeraceae bacterium]|nr:MAG: hypothetical protein H6810_12165 [Phycisphaeraceae bacterium]